MRSVSAMKYAVVTTLVIGCTTNSVHAGHGMESASASSATSGTAMTGAMGATTRSQGDVAADTARLRAATAAFRSHAAALAAGYAAKNPACISHPTMGAMGYHLNNDKLMDVRIEVERPEVLVYRRTPAGEFELTGVEYMVPFSAHPPTAPAPTVMGQELKPFAPGKFWYRHVWAWLDNPSGLFEDWNPRVSC
jgi:hypothetical protein